MTDPITRLRSLGIILAMLSIPVGCGEAPSSTEPDSLNLIVTAATVGDDLDPDGYTISIDGAPGVALPSNGEVAFPDLSTATSHPYEILGIAPNCRMTNGPTSGLLDTPSSPTTVQIVFLCLQPDPGRIIYGTTSQIIRTRDALGGDLQTLPVLGRSFSVTQDGELIAYEFSGDIWVANIDGSGTVNLTNTAGFAEGQPHWSPDGTRIVYHLSEGSNPFDIFVMNEDGSGVTNLTPGTPDWTDNEPAWSPDGTRIAFGSSRTGTGDLYTMAPDGSDLVKLTDGVIDTNPSWSPDSQRIVFTRFLDPFAEEPGTDFELFVINSDGTDLTQLTGNGLFRTTDADWSPDGQWMIIARQELTGQQSWDLYVMRSDGSQIVRLTFSEGAFFPRWIP